ncbi:MAG: hypothetical protein PHX61_06185 [Alphaproteobacteria bacterium]|nr:hypothetical protein [Alphaproteobacteria bacterium]
MDFKTQQRKLLAEIPAGPIPTGILAEVHEMAVRAEQQTSKSIANLEKHFAERHLSRR